MSAQIQHLTAITGGTVTATNVIGIRKAVNHVTRLRLGWSGNRSNATPGEVAALVQAMREREPRIAGKLHETGLKQLRDPRYAKRFDEVQRAIIERDDATFSLVGFDMIGKRGQYAVPVYRMSAPHGYFEHPRTGKGWATGGSFLFRNIPWQAVFGSDEYTSGPQVLEAF